jgi:hypothetical protein
MQEKESYDPEENETSVEMHESIDRENGAHSPTAELHSSSSSVHLAVEHDTDEPITLIHNKRNIFKWKSHIKACIVVLIVCLLMGALIFISVGFFIRQGKCQVFEVGVSQYSPISASSLLNNIKQVNKNYAAEITTMQQRIFPTLYKISEVINDMFMVQVWQYNLNAFNKLKSQYGSSCDGSVTEFYEINMGPWDRLKNNSYYLGVYYPTLSSLAGNSTNSSKPLGANFYPADMTRQEFLNWIGSMDPNSALYQNAVGFYYVIRRDANGKLISVPYSEEYKEQIATLNTLITQLIDLLPADEMANLIQYLQLRAQAFVSNNYTESEIAWLGITDSNSLLEITLGPYETYEDQLFGYKAAFEIFVGITDPIHSANLQQITSLLPSLNQALPMDQQYKSTAVINPNTKTVIRVVDQVMNGGDARKGVQTAAYNLPNDPKIVENYGSKKVLLRNVQNAKYDLTLLPIANAIIRSDQLPYLQFDAFFTHVMAHELMHAMGPQFIYNANQNATSDNVNTPVRVSLQEYYAVIEEAKADAGGLWILSYILNNNLMDLNLTLSSGAQALQSKLKLSDSEMVKRCIYVTYLASIFRALRFDDAHSQANVLIFNYLNRRGAINIQSVSSSDAAATQSPSYYVSVNFQVIDSVIESLTALLLNTEAIGDKQNALNLIQEYAQYNDDDLVNIISQINLVSEDSSNPIPVDIRIAYRNEFI